MPKKLRKGVVSLDALILFTAIVIVVGVTAIVLLSSGSALQLKSLTKASESRKQINAGLEVINVIGRDASVAGGSPHFLEDIYIMVRLLPGSTHHPLNSTLILYDDGTDQYALQYNATCPSMCSAASTMTYNVFYINSGPHWEAGHVNLGDVAKISLKLPNPMVEQERYLISILPLYGPRTTIEIDTPPMMMSEQVTIWPVA